MVSAYIFLWLVSNLECVIVCINYSVLYRIMYSYDTDVQMITSSNDLVIIFFKL